MKRGTQLRLSEHGPVWLISGYDNSMSYAWAELHIDSQEISLTWVERCYDLDICEGRFAILHEDGLHLGPPESLVEHKKVWGKRVGLTRARCFIGNETALSCLEDPELRFEEVVDFAARPSGLLLSVGERLLELDAAGAVVDEHAPGIGPVTAVAADEVGGGWLLGAADGVFQLHEGLTRLSAPLPSAPAKVRRGPRAVWIILLDEDQRGGRLYRAAPGELVRVPIEQGYFDFDANARGGVVQVHRELYPLNDDATLGP